MKRSTTLAGLAMYSSFCAAGGYEDALKKACSENNPWKLPAIEYAETPIALGMPDKQQVTICNCTEPSDKANPSVWVLTMPPDLPPDPAPPAKKGVLRA